MVVDVQEEMVISLCEAAEQGLSCQDQLPAEFLGMKLQEGNTVFYAGYF